MDTDLNFGHVLVCASFGIAGIGLPALLGGLLWTRRKRRRQS